MTQFRLAHTGRQAAGIQILGLLALALLITGCSGLATQKGFYDDITAELRAEQYDSAVVLLEAANEKGKYDEKDRFVYYLDHGLALSYAERYDSSNASLHQADIAAEELWTKSVTRAAASVLLNDNMLEYPGEDYEHIYGDLIAALNYLRLGQFDEAFVEIRQVNLKLERLEQKYADAELEWRRQLAKDTAAADIDYEWKKVRFYNDAFARYLSMHLYAADGLLDDADIDYRLLEEAFTAQPEVYPFAMPDVTYHSDEGAVLSVIGLAGLSPVKEEESLRIRTDKDLDLVQILYKDKDEEVPEYGHIIMPIGEDYYFKFAMPELVDRPSWVSGIRVYANGELLGYLELLEDVGLVARDVFGARKSWIFIRTLFRTVWKGLAAAKAKKDADTGGFAGWLKKAAIDVATDLSENPDLRCSRLLPDRIYVGDFVLPPGEYTLTIEFLDDENQVVKAENISNYMVTERGPNIVHSVGLQ